MSNSNARHLLAVAVGPVQDFIQSGRRTRDLWAGSQLLSDISRAAAEEIRKSGTLIFPGVEPDAALPKNVANIILAELEPGAEPKDVAAAAKKAALDRWRDWVKKALDQWGRFGGGFLHEELIRGQTEDVLEFYGAWTELTHEYSENRKKVMRLLAGRKSLRDFQQSTFNGLNYPKSSLDGARETVLKKECAALAESSDDEDDQLRRLKRDLRLRRGEELDVVGLVKRTSEVKYFPSVSRISASPWLRGLAREGPELLAQLQEKSSQIGWTKLVRTEWPQFEEFPFDGTVVYRTRHREIRDLGLSVQESEALTRIGQLLIEARKKFGEPQPYLAVIAADGDRMGRLIAQLESSRKHREFSIQLAKFASSARAIAVENFGCCVYAGGDDVLCLVPVDRALAVARQLHDRFGEMLSAYNSGRPEAEWATLSVGIAIGHHLEPLEDLLRCARSAEKAAKGSERDGVAVWFHPRSGSALGVRAQWKSKFADWMDRFVEWHVSGTIPDQAAYGLMRLANLYEEWPHKTAKENDERWGAYLADAVRLLSRKRKSGMEAAQKQLSALEEQIPEARSLSESPRVLAECLVIARRIAYAVRQSRGGEG